MTNEQKKQIEALRLNSMSYGKIAEATGVNRESVKAYCRRHGLQSADLICFEFCLQCGKKLEQIEGRKKKKFCSDACRMEWWNKHQDILLYKEKNRKECEFCGNEFYSNKDTSRFCSCKCYADYRRLGGKSNAEKASQDSTDDKTSSCETSEADVERTDSGRAGLPPLQPHPACDECPWFILGQRIIEINEALAKAVQADNIKPDDEEG